MTPERVAALVARWVRAYTRGLPAPIADRRVAEIQADLHDHIAFGRAHGMADARIAVDIASRMVRGLPADVTWRDEQRAETERRHRTPGGPMPSPTIVYRSAVALALGTAVFLLWGVAAMGMIGAEGDPFDLLYFAVLGVGIVGAALARLRPEGMVRTLLAMAAVQAVIAVIGLAVGKHLSPVSSVLEIVGLNAFFVGLFLASAWLFGRAARASRTYDGLGA